jgi:hypothetical protein
LLEGINVVDGKKVERELLSQQAYYVSFVVLKRSARPVKKKE